MIRFLFTVLATLIASSLACAAGGGHSQKFDPNAYGGAANVSCLGPAIAGICATGYDAKCAGGSTDNTVAYTNFVTANISGNAVLYADIGTAVPPQQHSICNDIGWGTTLSAQRRRSAPESRRRSGHASRLRREDQAQPRAW